MPLSAAKTSASNSGGISLEHYFRVILHRKWLVITAFVVITGITVAISSRMPDIYTSETVIMVDPQKVPEAYVKSTVTGDVRNRLGTLSQQILSATRLQKVIDTFNLYPEEKKKNMAREDIIMLMRKDITVSMVGGSGNNNQDVQAFKIGYSGTDPRLVARVATEITNLFIDENLKAREQQATGTTDFLTNQLEDTKKALEGQEAKLRDFKLKHLGEMPEQQQATLQILGQLQGQLQIEADASNRAEQQKSYLQSMIAQSAPVVDLDEGQPKPLSESEKASAGKSPTAPTARRSPLETKKARLAALQTQGYTDLHPDIRKLRSDIATEEARQRQQDSTTTVAQAPAAPAPEPAAPKTESPASRPTPTALSNPVLQSQLSTIETEITKHKQEQVRLSKQISVYQGKLEAIPVREQQVAELVRDYEISKAHYKQLLDNQLSAETATQLEIRQKGEKFSVLDPAQPAEKPSRPNRQAINLGGSIAGLVGGFLLALVTELFGASITSPEQMLDATGAAVLGVIPIIATVAERKIRLRRLIWGVSAAALTAVVSTAALFYYRGQF
jgi:polysaccharide chain length determinant protein (PEP-CTERM system associated)